MTDKKLTDEQIIQGLECCATFPRESKCNDCTACVDGKCAIKPSKILNLINRQKAEIDKLETVLSEKLFCITQLKGENFALTNERDAYKNLLKNAKTEAVKEFAEKIKASKDTLFNNIYSGFHFNVIIDSIVKELAGENNG